MLTRQRLYAWAAYRPAPLFYAARLLAWLFPRDRVEAMAHGMIENARRMNGKDLTQRQIVEIRRIMGAE